MIKVRFGYVAIAKRLKGTTSSSRVTFTYYNKLNEKERFKKLLSVTKSNIDALDTIIRYNIKNNIHFYRISSALIPLATHPEVKWRFEKYFEDDLKKVGDLIKKHNMRVDLHPDQFNVLNSDKPHVVKNTIESLEYHHRILKSMGLQNEKLILHVGGATNGKEEAIKRFISNYKALPLHLKNRLIIENDDKVYTVDDVLRISYSFNPPIPVVYDIHHDRCNKVKLTAEKIRKIIESWKQSHIPVKVHISTGRTHKEDRSHHDYIDVIDLLNLVDLFKGHTRELDVMIEAKMKDEAMFKLIDDLMTQKRDIEVVDETTVIFNE